MFCLPSDLPRRFVACGSTSDDLRSIALLCLRAEVRSASSTRQRVSIVRQTSSSDFETWNQPVAARPRHEFGCARGNPQREWRVARDIEFSFVFGRLSYLKYPSPGIFSLGNTDGSPLNCLGLHFGSEYAIHSSTISVPSETFATKILHLPASQVF